MSEPQLPPAAWYPDPQDATQLRYWDGRQWTEHQAPAMQRVGEAGRITPETPETRLAAEAKAALWMRRGALAWPVATLITGVLTHHSVQNAIDQIRAAQQTRTDGGISRVNGTPIPSLGAVFIVLQVWWLVSSARSAKALGLPQRRDPGLAGGSLLIPVVNFWWPYQSTCDLFRPADRPRRLIAWWWATNLLYGAAAIAMLVAGLASDTVWAIAVDITVALSVVTNVLLRRLVARALDHHRDLLEASAAAT